jgi:hypothetical protein
MRRVLAESLLLVPAAVELPKEQLRSASLTGISVPAGLFYFDHVTLSRKAAKGL